MSKKSNNLYTSKIDLRNDIFFLKKNIESLNDENIIDHSKVIDIERRINEISSRIRSTDISNLKKTRIKNLKIFKTVLKHIAPYVLTIGLLFGLQTLTFDTPFVRQNQTRIANKELVVDNFDHVETNLSYILPSEVNDSMTATSISKWELKQDGNYYRTINKYNFKGLRAVYGKILANNIVNPNVSNKFYNIGEDPVSTKYEYKNPNELTNEELEKGEFVQLTIRAHFDDDIIIKIQDVTPNVLFTLLFLLVTVSVSFGIYEYMDNNRINKRFHNKLKELRSIYRELDIDNLERLFKEEKIKFDVIKKQDGYLTNSSNKKKKLVGNY